MTVFSKAVAIAGGLIVVALFLPTKPTPPAPVVAVEQVSPRERVTPVCMAAVDDASQWREPAKWVISKRSSGNYELMMSYMNKRDKWTLTRCIVDGSFKLVSVS